MSSYDYDDRRGSTNRQYYREERHAPGYDSSETYLRVNPSSRTDLIPRPREDSDLSVEEIRRDFPPPGYSRDVRRARSAEPGYYDEYYDRRDRDRGYDARSQRGDRDRDRDSKSSRNAYYYEEEKTRKRVLTKQDKIIAAVVGGVLAAGAKEVWDRREAKEEGSDINRNLAVSAALAAGGAFAGYQGAEAYNKYGAKEKEKTTVAHKARGYYSDDDEEDPKSHKGNKSFLESALAAAGLGGAIKALTGKDEKQDDSRSVGGRSRRGSPDSHKSSADTSAKRMQKAAKASLVAGAAEAFRVAREPGGWKGEKMKRIVTAAAGAATTNAALDPTKDSKMHLFESVMGGLVGNRMLNGSRKDIEEDKKTGRSRSRSRAASQGGGGSSGLAGLAAAGLGALGAKKLLDKRDESRGRRDESRRRGSPDSYDSRDKSPDRRHRSRSRSVVDGARRSLAKLGIGNGPSDDRSDVDDSRSTRKSRRARSPDYDEESASRGYMSGGRGRDDDDRYDDRSSRGGTRRNRSRQRGGRSRSASSSDLGDSDDDRKKEKKMRDKRRHHRHHDDDY